MKGHVFGNVKGGLAIVYGLIITNLLIFLLFSSIVFLFELSPQVFYDKIGVSPDFSSFLQKPWTIITYAFFHTHFLHLLVNMIFLYFVGILFLNLFDAWYFIKVYIGGIWVGGLFFMTSYHIFPVLEGRASFLCGASAGIMALFVFVATYTPMYKMYLWGVLKLPLWILAGVLILIDIISLPISNTGGRIAHLSGALVGFVWAYFLKNPIKRKPKKKKSHFQKMTAHDIEVQEKINFILKKISKSGYESLTNQEKEFLFKSSSNK